MENSLPAKYFKNYLEESTYPMLVFIEEQGEIQPILLHNHPINENITAYEYRNGQEREREDIDNILKKLVEDQDRNIIFVIPYSLHPLVSNDDSLIDKVSTPSSRMFKLLGSEKKDIFYIYFYALIISIISLSLPLGIQSIVNMISGGVIFNSIVLLITFVILGILIAGILQIMQYTIVEVVERRIFVKAAFEFTYRIPRLKTETILNNHAPELVNRFFDVLTIQKGLPKLLIDLTGSALQIIFGLLLLAFYHPFFVFFGLLLITTLIVIFYITGPKGLKTNLVESKYKYMVVHWLEEMARTMFAFKLAGHTSLPMQKMDGYVNNYLHYRKKHFTVLMTQFFNIVGFKTIVTGGLLIIGSWLVIDRQITLGQFVATEIVIILILTAVEKLILSMSTIYDVLTGVEKIGNVTDIPLEKKGGILLPHGEREGFHIQMKNLTYQYPGHPDKTLGGVTLNIPAQQRLCIAGFNDSGKNTLGQVLSGILDSYKGLITYNGISLRDLNLTSLRDNIAKTVWVDDIFDGTILENITMGKPAITYQDVIWALESVGLADMVNSMPDGLLTNLAAGGKRLSSSVALRLSIARCIAEKPRVIIMNDVLHKLEKADRIRILQFLLDKKHPWTIIFISNDPMVMASTERVVVMKEGKIAADGNYEELKANKAFQDILVYPYKQDVA
jgi:ABC-type bacteriocin/lantibiotic exporter with double-glycine peptidase domain